MASVEVTRDMGDMSGIITVRIACDCGNVEYRDIAFHNLDEIKARPICEKCS